MVTITYDSKNYTDHSMNDLYYDLENDLKNDSIDDANNWDYAVDNLIGHYKNKTDSSIQVINDMFRKDIRGNNVASLGDYKSTQKKHDFKDAQNETTKIDFMEKYLFLIVKIIMFVVILLVVLFTFRQQLSFNVSLSSMQNKFMYAKQQTDETINKLVSKTQTTKESSSASTESTEPNTNNGETKKNNV